MFSFDQADGLDYERVSSLYSTYSNKYIPSLYGKFTFGREVIKRAEGAFVYSRDNERYLDMTGGLGVANMGHNHPRILEVRKRFSETKSVEIHKNYLNRFLAAASANLAEVLPGDLNYSFFCNSGAESVDGALKISYRVHRGKRKLVLKSDRSFHGKLIGAGSLSTGDNFVAGNARFSFQKIPGVLTYQFNDIDSVVQLLKAHEENIYAIFLEPFSCSTLTECDDLFLKTVIEECRKRKIIVVFDEIYSGFAKCGPNFYMEKFGHLPDIVCLSKALGGGKSSISAYVARTWVFEAAYGDYAGALLHSTTYNSFGEESVTALEALNILVEERLSEKSFQIQRVLEERLTRLQQMFPEIIRDVRGAGTHFGIILNTKLQSLQPLMNLIPIAFFQDPLFLEKLVVTSYIEKYYCDHKIITAFTSNQDVIWNFSPSPVTPISYVEASMDSLETVFKTGPLSAVKDFAIKNFKELL